MLTKSHLPLVGCFVLMLFMAACGAETSQVEAEGQTAEEAPAAEAATEMEEEKFEDHGPAVIELADDEIREYGKVTAVEDGPYPFYSVTIEFPERNMRQSFTVNVEGMRERMDNLKSLEGKYVTFYYLSELTNNLIDMHFEGTSLEGEYAPEFDASWKKVVGTLSGAETETGGDLPDNISVTDAAGTVYEFEVYISDAYVAANGKEVTAYYDLRGVETITYIQASEGE